MTFPAVLRLAPRDVLRQRLRAGMTCCAIAFGVAGLIVAGGFVEDVLTQLAEGTIHSQTGHLQVFERGFVEQGARTPEKYVMGDPSSVKGTIARMPQVKEVLERVTFNGLLSHRRSDLPIVGEGVEPSKETALGGALRASARGQQCNVHPNRHLGQRPVTEPRDRDSDAIRCRPIVPTLLRPALRHQAQPRTCLVPHRCDTVRA